MGNQNPSRSTIGVVPTKDEKKLQPKRTEIFKEIVATEKSYVNALTELHEKWEKPLIAAARSNAKPIISEKDINNIFTISEGILCLHQNLLKQLEGVLSQWDENQTIGDIFIRNATALKLYTEYINRYNVSVETLDKVIQQNTFKEFARSRCKGNPAHVLTSLLIQPIQRIPRYEMLLKDLLKCTWMSHPDYDNLELAVEKIVEAAAYNNEQKRKAESLMRLLEIQNDLDDVIFLHESGRDIVKEGSLKIPNLERKERKGKKKILVSYCLMNDKLLIWREKQILMFGDLSEIKFELKPETNDIILTCTNPSQQVTIIFKKPEEKNEWCELFRKTKKEKQNRDNQIQKAVFIVPTVAVNEKAPLLGSSSQENQQSECCCIIL